MPPRKRKAELSADSTAAPVRVTRSSTKRSDSSSVSQPVAKFPEEEDEKKKKAKGKKKEKKVEDEGSEVMDEKVEGEAPGNVIEASNKAIVIEHCKQCNSFKTRAIMVKEGLEKSACGVTVIVNPEKPRRGCFEIRQQGGKKFISLLDMKRPFKPMKDLDMEKVISDIIDEISNAS